MYLYLYKFSSSYSFSQKSLNSKKKKLHECFACIFIYKKSLIKGSFSYIHHSHLKVTHFNFTK